MSSNIESRIKSYILFCFIFSLKDGCHGKVTSTSSQAVRQVHPMLDHSAARVTRIWSAFSVEMRTDLLNLRPKQGMTIDLLTLALTV